MSKIKRQDFSTKESYNITEDWLLLFAHELEKQGYLSNLKPVIQRKVYSSIEEKMADIKDRIGFDLITKLNSELEDLSKVSQAKSSCGCGGDEPASCACPVKTAAYEHPKRDLEMMQNILNYIHDMVKAEPYLDPTAIISRCKDTEGLGFNRLRIDQGRLKNYISDLLNKYGSDESDEVKYVKREPDSASANNGIDQADYYSHARPES